MAELLRLEGVRAGYGDAVVINDISFALEAGGSLALLGRNGMGKTTTVKSIVGLLKPLAGTVRFRGQAITGCAADCIGRAGIGLVPEGRQIFPNLSVRENLTAWASNRSNATHPWTLARVFDFFPKLAERQHHMGNQLSGGEQQMLAIARVLMTNPHLLILDEATEGLAPLIRQEIWQCLAALKAAGLSLLLIDKNVRKLVDIADRHYIIERGRIEWQGDSSALAGRQDLWHRYLGV